MHGTASKTAGGLTKTDLKKNAAVGAIVSRKQSARAKRDESPLLKLWRDSVKAAYANPKYCGRFVKIHKGSTFYKEIKKEYQARCQSRQVQPEEKEGRQEVTPKKKC